MSATSLTATDEAAVSPCDLMRCMAAEALRSGVRLLTRTPPSPFSGDGDPLRSGQAFTRLAWHAAMAPWMLWPSQLALANDFHGIARQAFLRTLGIDTPEVVPTPAGDRRFRDPAWADGGLFDATRQYYLATSRRVLEGMDAVTTLDTRTADKLRFITGQNLDALAPGNFLASNPQALRETRVSGGANLARGLANLLADLERSDGRFDVSPTRWDAFEVGGNLATTPGKVVFQNELLQLIQYAPMTPEVARRPLLVMPPWMNKYYILDLGAESSFLRWLVEQGHTVFVVSWVNPDRRLADRNFEDYMRDGLFAAIDAIEQATGEHEVNVIGYCLGGILLSAALAVAAARGDRRIASATLLTTMVDFSDAGDVKLFLDEDGLNALERRITAQGYLDGASVGATFRSFRANDLVWSFYVNNYLLGKTPRPFDLLYWNADTTNMPAACHLFIMRNLYLRNLLREPDALVLDGTPVDVRRVKTPTYVLSTLEDHIAPWKTAYQTTQLFGGPLRFVLGASGHIAGVVNPPARGKYGYWSGADLPPDADAWLAAASEHAGSWWPDWAAWIARYSRERVPARVPGEGALPVIEDAPGTYVRTRHAPR